MHAIYNPVSTYTRSEREAAAAHRARLRRIAARAVVDAPIVLRAPKAEIVPEPLPQLPEESWAERQKRLYPEVKKPWFSIVSEGEIREPRRPTFEAIFRAVLAHFPNVTMTDLLSARRDHAALIPRHISMYVAKKMTLRSLPEIGRRLGNRDHTTVLSAVRRVEHLRKTKEKVDSDICTIIAALGGVVE